MSPILPPKGGTKLTGSTVYLSPEAWEKLKEIADQTKAEDGKGYSRNEVIIHFLEWAMREYEKERQAEKVKKLKK